jgi:NAD(P)-dependent dehydrogenase (short-subunit alcohol dehydrogenase family)
MGTRLQGRVAVITGGSNGIGLATAKKFLDEGAKVVIGDVNAEAGTAIAEELGASFVAVDVTDPDQVEALFKTAFDTYGSVDIAFNNAEISSLADGSILTTGLDTWRDVHEANLTSIYLCCRVALRYMLEHKHGSIINSASVAAVLGSATSQIAYTATKGGVLSLSRELGVQFARDGIRVNALCHGPVSTPLSQELADSDPDSAERQLARIPMGRFAEPQEIASAVLFLASDESSFITASQFMVDGGISGAYVTPI